MSRKEELEKCFQGLDEEIRIVIDPLLDELCFIEKQLQELKANGFKKFHPHNPDLIKRDYDKARQYVQFYQQYNNTIKMLSKLIGSQASDEESPLREWVNSQNDR